MIMQIVIGLAVVVGAKVLYYVVTPLLTNARTNNKQSVFYTVLNIAQTVVNALQQEIQGEGKGAEKKAKAVATIKEILARDFNIAVSDELIDKAIEAAVFLMKRSGIMQGSEILPYAGELRISSEVTEEEKNE